MSANPMRQDERYCEKCGQLFAVHNGDGSCVKDSEFTDAETDRQDNVDNAIYEMATSLFGKFPEWDMQYIGEVRDALMEWAKATGIPEMEFYPYRALTPREEQAAYCATEPNNTVETTIHFWECACVENFIHAKGELKECAVCGQNEKDMPDARIDEVADWLSKFPREWDWVQRYRDLLESDS